MGSDLVFAVDGDIKAILRTFPELKGVYLRNTCCVKMLLEQIAISPSDRKFIFVEGSKLYAQHGILYE